MLWLTIAGLIVLAVGIAWMLVELVATQDDIENGRDE